VRCPPWRCGHLFDWRMRRRGSRSRCSPAPHTTSVGSVSLRWDSWWAVWARLWPRTRPRLACAPLRDSWGLSSRLEWPFFYRKYYKDKFKIFVLLDKWDPSWGSTMSNLGFSREFTLFQLNSRKTSRKIIRFWIHKKIMKKGKNRGSMFVVVLMKSLETMWIITWKIPNLTVLNNKGVYRKSKQKKLFFSAKSRKSK
jgi:hypothetical protein